MLKQLVVVALLIGAVCCNQADPKPADTGAPSGAPEEGAPPGDAPREAPSVPAGIQFLRKYGSMTADFTKTAFDVGLTTAEGVNRIAKETGPQLGEFHRRHGKNLKEDALKLVQGIQSNERVQTLANMVAEKSKATADSYIKPISERYNQYAKPVIDATTPYVNEGVELLTPAANIVGQQAKKVVAASRARRAQLKRKMNGQQMPMPMPGQPMPGHPMPMPPGQPMPMPMPHGQPPMPPPGMPRPGPGQMPPGMPRPGPGQMPQMRMPPPPPPRS